MSRPNVSGAGYVQVKQQQSATNAAENQFKAGVVNRALNNPGVANAAQQSQDAKDSANAALLAKSLNRKAVREGKCTWCRRYYRSVISV